MPWRRCGAPVHDHPAQDRESETGVGDVLDQDHIPIEYRRGQVHGNPDSPALPEAVEAQEVDLGPQIHRTDQIGREGDRARHHHREQRLTFGIVLRDGPAELGDPGLDVLLGHDLDRMIEGGHSAPRARSSQNLMVSITVLGAGSGFRVTSTMGGGAGSGKARSGLGVSSINPWPARWR